MTEREKKLASLQLTAYGLYQLDWCADRMIDIQQLNHEKDSGCESFAQFKESLFFEKEFMEYLLPEDLFTRYCELVAGEMAENA